MAATATRTHSVSSETASDAGIDRIKEILVGDYNRDWEQRLAQLGSQFAEQMELLRQDMTHKMQDLDTYLRREIDALNERARREEAERLDGLKRIENQLGESARETRAQAFAASTRFHAELDDRYVQLNAAIKSSFDLLCAEKTDRRLLGTLFQEIGKRLAIAPSGSSEGTSMKKPG